MVRVEDRAKLLNLAPQHIWSPQFIHGRYDWEPYKPVFVLLLRAYTLAAPVVRPVLTQYGGCRSWVEMAEPVSTWRVRRPPSRTNAIERRRALTLRLLEGE